MRMADPSRPGSDLTLSGPMPPRRSYALPLVFPTGEAAAAPQAADAGRRSRRPHRLSFGLLWEIVSWTAALLFAVASALALAFVVVSHLSPTGEYTVFGRPVLSVVSGSMAPGIRVGDLIVDQPVSGYEAAHLHVGQVITFSAGSTGQRFFTHRIVAVHRSGRGQVSYTTQGDANNAPDAGEVPAAAVIGVYWWKLPAGGYALDALRRPLVLALLVVGLLAALGFGPALRWLRREENSERRGSLTS